MLPIFQIKNVCLEKNLFLYLKKNNFFLIFFSQVLKFTWKMRNVLRNRKHQISDFYYPSYVHLNHLNLSRWFKYWGYLNHPSFRWIFTITPIFHWFQHIPHLPWKTDKNWEGGICISLVEKRQTVFLYFSPEKIYFLLY